MLEVTFIDAETNAHEDVKLPSIDKFENDFNYLLMHDVQVTVVVRPKGNDILYGNIFIPEADLLPRNISYMSTDDDNLYESIAMLRQRVEDYVRHCQAYVITK